MSRDWNAVFSGIAAMAERGAEGRRGTGDSLSAKSILAVYDFTGDAELTCLTTCGRLILAGMQDGSVSETTTYYIYVCAIKERTF